MPKIVRQLGNNNLRIIELPIQDTIKDIKLYISSRIADLPVEGVEQVAELTDQIIAKSNTSFLWVRLVMDELQGVYSSESIMEVLQGIPEGMVSYYKRTVTEMAGNKRERHIAKAMLQWVALAARPLSTLELAYALSIDVNTQVSSPKSAIEGLCGHLISIDEEYGHVRIVHNTAREFLASDDAGYFQISKAEAHERIALVCLEVLCGPEMQPPKHRRMLEQKRPQADDSALLDYAVCHFSDHIASASASSDELLTELAGFLSSTTLTWIDKVATKGGMHHLVSTARNLKTYLIQRSKHSPTVERHMMCVDSWVTDLGRLAVKFHSALSTYPQSIYFLIPPLCPTESAIHRQFRRMHDSLTLLGSADKYWDDCVATLDFGDKSTATVSCGEDLIAVGFESGDIAFYNNRIQEADLVIKNDLAVYLLHFDPHGSFIAGTSRRFLMLWDLQGNLLWQTRVRVRFFQLAFSSTYVLGATQQGKALKWDIETGELIEEHAFAYQSPNDDENDTNSSPPSKAPLAVSVSPNLELIALAYRNGPVCLFVLEGSDFIGWVLNGNKRCPQYVIFNPSPDVNLLLVIYNESHMSLFDPWSGDLVNEYNPEKPMITLSATCSPSGQTFATVDVQGNLRIWDFESLAVLYHIVTPNPAFRMLGFTSDNFNLLDVTNHKMKVWSPPSALRRTAKEEASTSDLPGAPIVSESQFKTLESARVRAFKSHPRYPALFGGKNNGDVVLYNLTDGKEMGVLYTHQEGVRHIASCRENVIASSDFYNIVQVWTLTIRRPTMIQPGELKFKFRAPPAIRQLLLDDTGEYLLVSTTQGDAVYRTSNGMMIGSMDWTGGKRKAWKWIAMPEHGQGPVFALIENHALSYYTASSFPGTSPLPPTSLDYEIDEGLEEVGIDAFLHPSTRHLVLQYSTESMDTAQSSMVLFQLPLSTDSKPSSLSPLPMSSLDPLSQQRLKYVLGFTSPPDSRLLFLSNDSWLCSISIQGNISQYTRHFFVPHEYTTPNDEIRPIHASGDAFVFSLFDNVAIIKNGLKFERHVSMAVA
jgi:WD40 repeat protein